MLKVLRELLVGIIHDIDAGNSNIEEEDEVKIIEILKQYTRKDKPMSKYQAYTYLNMSRATFDNLVKDDKLPKGTKVAGFKELFWYKKDLDKAIEK